MSVIDAGTYDRIRAEARAFDLNRALITALVFPFVALGWAVAHAWTLVALVIGFVVAGFKVGWHTARGDAA